MLKIILQAVAVLVSCGAIQAQQTSTPPLHFEIVSIHEGKLAPGDSLIVGGAFSGPHSARMDLTNFTVKKMMVLAFGIDEDRIEGIPQSMQNSFYVVHARSDEKMDAALGLMSDSQAAAAQREMLQEVLADRFHLHYHLATRIGTSFFLLAGPSPKLQPASPTEENRTPDYDPTLPKLGVICDGHGCTLECHGQSMDWLANMLHAQVDGPVTNKTNLKGLYDFTLRWSQPFGSGPDSGDDFPQLPAALASELGLHLKSGKVSESTIVVDHLDRPTPN
jgi:uncharacterized protein (TIGR03435 family)